MIRSRAKVEFSRPFISKEETEAVKRVIESGWWTTGKIAGEFERRFSEYLGSRYCLAVNSGTAALHLALKVLGIKKGGEVILPTMTFAATGEVVIHCGLKPILCDCNLQTLNIDLPDLKKRITKRTKAIIAVHMAGLAAPMDEIRNIAKKYGLYVIEDAAHALGAEYKGRKAGTLGHLAAFSFYATKPISCGEGGMLVTANKELLTLARSLSLHGLSHNAWSRYSLSGLLHYKIINAGFKYNMPDILAALGLYQLKKANLFLRIRERYAGMYARGLKDNPAIELPSCPQGFRHAWHLYVIKLNLENLIIGRNEFIAKLRKEGVGASVHFVPLHLHPFYMKAFKYRKEEFPNATMLSRRILSLPLYPSMKVSDVEFVISKVLKTAAGALKKKTYILQ